MSLRKLPVLNNERPDLCAPCGGRCCRNGPGIAAAADFGRTPQAIGREVRRRLRIGTWKLDGDSEVVFMRPANTEDGSSPWGIDEGAPCVFLGTHGCSLTFADRPKQCRDVTPRGAGNKCTIGHRAFLAIMRTWQPFKHILNRAAKELLTAQRSEES